MVDVLGTKLGRYELRERLGRGGMATVYKGWDTNLDRWVAVKVLHDHLADDVDFKKRFSHEAKLIAGLNHPNIVQIYDFDEVDRADSAIYYMVMPFVDGPSLWAVMSARQKAGERMSLAEVSRVMESVCGALSYAHQQGITHRDVTPGNILFTERGQIVLADFGLARLVSGARLTQTGTTIGTPVYMSPEQGMGLPGDTRSDIYSLGIILFEMLAGRTPFDGDSAFAIIMKHVNDPIPNLGKTPNTTSATMSAALQTVIGRALAKDANDRYQTADEFLADFKQVVSGELPTGLVGAVSPAASKLSTGRPPQTMPMTTPAAQPTRLMTGLTSIVATPESRRITAIVAAVIVIGLVIVGTMAKLDVSGSRPTPVPTLTSAGDAMTDASVPVMDDFSKPGDHAPWVLDSTDPRVVRMYSGGSLQITNTIPNKALPTIIALNYTTYGGSVIIRSTLTLSAKSQPESGTGIIFRYEDDTHYYLCAFDGLGRVSVWLRNGEWTELRQLPANQQWTRADGVNKAGQPNQMTVMVDDNQIRCLINGQPLIDVHRNLEMGSGGVGIYLATTTNANATNPYAQVNVAAFQVQMPDNSTATPVKVMF